MAIGYPDWGTDTAVYGWATEGEKTAPPAGTLMADTGVLFSGFYQVVALLSGGTGAMAYSIEHWALSGRGINYTQFIRLPANSALVVTLPGLYRAWAGDHFRIYTQALGAGICQCSLIFRRYAG